MSDYGLNEFADMNDEEIDDLYADLVYGESNLLETAYARMLDMPLSKENISLEFIKARVPFPLIVGLGDLDVVKNMINNGVDVNALGAPYNWIALHMACSRMNVKMTELLLQNKADINAYDSSDETPLMSLFEGFTSFNKYSNDIIDNCYQMTRLLVSYGAKLVPSHTDYTMITAVTHANLSTVMLLANEAGGDLTYRAESGRNSCLHWAVSNRQPGVLEYVLGVFKKKNMDIDSLNEQGNTPLHMASDDYVGDENIKILLKSGADFRIKNNEGLTSFDLLIEVERNAELAWLYFDLGFDILGGEVASLDRAVRLRSPWMADIVAEIARQEMMGARVVGKNLQVFNQYGEARILRRFCKKQLGEMRKIKFCENLSFWDVISADQSKLKEYAENSELVEAFFQAKCNGSFPTYCTRMRHRLFEMLSRNSLIDLSTAVVCEMIKLPATMYEVMQHEVMTYMKDEDFSKILGCCCSKA